MIRVIFLLITILLIFPVYTYATIINIPADYPAIQQGIDASSNGDTVLVQPGTYVENINFNGHNIVLGSLFLTTGDTSYISATIIDGDSAGTVVTFESGEDGTAVVIGFTLRNGFALYGGAIKCLSNSNPTICNNVIIGNSPFFGGGIFCDYSEPTICNNAIYENLGRLFGGGVYLYYSNVTMINNVFSGNRAGRFGGGVCIIYSSPIIINTICWADTAGEAGNEIFEDISSPTISFCNIQGGWPGEGNIDVDPLFRDPDSGDFHLMSTACGDSADSPCIDAGDPNILDSLLDCSWGLGTPRSDMGAYGGGDSALVGIIENLPPLPSQYILLQNFPNPFNASTNIRFVLSKPHEVTLTIYDLLGRQIETLLDEHKQAGIHSITFDASDLSSGVYFYRLQAGDVVETKRMVLLK